jgi:transcriptional antiterminator
MTKKYALQKLLEHGPLTRQELREITGWTDREIHYTLAYCSREGKIVKNRKAWALP